MKKVSSGNITETVALLVERVSFSVPRGIREKLRVARNAEKGAARRYLDAVLENMRVAKKIHVPICQDTGIGVVFVEMGPDVSIRYSKGDNLLTAVNRGIKEGYRRHYLRKSVAGALDRKNTGDNTPAVVHVIPQHGEVLRITLMAKGFGAENTSRLAMLSPGDGREGIEEFISDTVVRAGSNACPPMVLGVLSLIHI